MRKIFPLTSVAEAALLICAAAVCNEAGAITPLDDAPPLSNVEVPGNLALAVSVEFPTAISVAHIDNTYSPTTKFIGYFDHNKCYSYNTDAYPISPGDPREYGDFFVPVGTTLSGTNFTCSGAWSGNFLNWATMQTIDTFRWKLTGGHRVIDDESITVLQKAKSSNQGGDGNFPNRALTNGTIIAGATPFPASTTRLDISTRTRGVKFHFIANGSGAGFSGTAERYNGTRLPIAAREYAAFARVQVCVDGVGFTAEEKCIPYSKSKKPEGLMQENASKQAYSVFGYALDEPASLTRDGGVLRARQKFIGPSILVPNSTAIPNPNSEWDAKTGVMNPNPDIADADATNAEYGIDSASPERVVNSGVMNYLNKFGSLNLASNYKTFDPVGELYYTAIRYFKNQGPVPEYSKRGSTSAEKFVDGFPIINKWDDPIRYRCQRNTIVGIGDVNTHADRNLPGATGRSEPGKPPAVAADSTVDALEYTKRVGSMSGIANLADLQGYNGCCNNNGALMAGLAYHSNVNDIRPDTDPRMLGKQSIQTYWMDVLENRVFKANNQYYLAAKYGGSNVPPTYVAGRDIPESAWYTTTERTLNGDRKPDNYFTGGNPQQMAEGLEEIFKNSLLGPPSYSSSLATSQPQLVTAGAASYGSRYDPRSWTSILNANVTTFDAVTGTPTSTLAWEFSAKLAAQASSSGIDKSRRIVSWDGSRGVAFTMSKLSARQQTALDTAFVPGDDSRDYLNYLRGDRKDEVSGSGRAIYRDRSSLVSDIVNFKIRTVSPPSAPLSESFNPGYSAFKTKYATRPTVVYAGTNGGMIHAINGATTGPKAGEEIFAYIPNAVFEGPSGTSAVNGIQALGNPTFKHFNRIDGRAAVADLDLGRTYDRTARRVGSTTDWRTLLVGGFGKGAKAIYALDVTDPDNSVDKTKPLTEDGIADKVLWEFKDPDLGYIFSQPSVFKTALYGWVIMVGSGYNNSVDGRGYFFLINPKDGSLLQKIPTEIRVGSARAETGLAAVSAFVNDLSDGVADAAYAGDLLGNLWRVDMTSTTTPYPAAKQIAVLKDAANDPLPMTVSPFPAEEPGSQRRWITVGTGRLLANSDVANPQANRFFAIGDGFNGSFNRDANLPAGMTFPLQVSNFLPITDLSKPNKVDFKTNIGWYIDLGKTASGPGWRVVGESDVFFGRVAFPAVAPVVTDVCSPSGISRVYAVSLGEGTSTLLPKGKAYYEFGGLSTELITASVGGKPLLLGGDDVTGSIQKFDEAGITSPGVTRINWREIKGTSGR